MYSAACVPYNPYICGIQKETFIQVSKAIRHLVDSAGTNSHAASLALGKSRECVRNASKRPSPSLATVADICDFDVIIRDRRTGAEATIAPPRRTNDDGQLGEDDVRYDFVSTYEELMDKVMQ